MPYPFFVVQANREPHNEVTIFESQLRNHSLTMYDQDWVTKFDFSVPPPSRTSTSVPSTPVRTTFQPTCASPTFQPTCISPTIQPTYASPTFQPTCASPPFYSQNDVFVFPSAQPESISVDPGAAPFPNAGCLGVSQGKF